MRAGRSRTPDRIERVQTRYQKVRTENRGGKNFRRRLKSVCLQYLENLLVILQELTRLAGGFHSEACARRQRQAEDAHWWVKEGGWLPLKGEKIFERGESDLDSELAESVHCVSSSESEEDPRPRPSSTPKPKARPRERRHQRCSAGRTIFISEGHIIKPTASSRPSIVSVDWHQVLDIKRQKRGISRPSPPYTLLPEYESLIRELKSKGVVVIVNSYCCSPEYRDSVQSLTAKYPGLFDYVITTTKRCKEGGKLWALQSIVRLATSRIIHFDDNLDILKELVDYQERRTAQGGHQQKISAVGIRVPGKKKHQEVRYFWNLEEAFEQLDIQYLLDQLRVR